MQLLTNKLTCLSGTNSTGVGILVMYPRLALNSQFSWDWIIHMYHLPGIFYIRIESALGQCPGGPDGFLTNKSMTIKEEEGY